MRHKVALITGSAKGLGKMTALRLADEGCDIALNYVHSQTEAEELRQVIEAKGVRCLSLQGDISIQEDITRLIGEVQDRLGGVDIMVNNAGPFIRERRLFAEYSVAEIHTMIQGNLVGTMLLDHLVLPHMRNQQWGRIIHFGFGHAGEARAWAASCCVRSRQGGAGVFYEVTGCGRGSLWYHGQYDLSRGYPGCEQGKVNCRRHRLAG